MKNGVNVFFLLDLKILLHLTWRNQNFCGYYNLQGTILEEIFFEVSYNVILF